MWRRVVCLAVGFCAGVLPIPWNAPAWGVPYASAVRNVSGNLWEFVLNEPASSIQITRNGGNAISINNPAAGRHTFDMTGFSTFEIAVNNNAPSGWTRISSLTNPFTNYELPNGLAVNTNPSSPYFGTIYIVNGRTNSTAAGRPMGDGVYALTADMVGVNLPSFSAVTNPNDATLAKKPASWNVGGSASSAWRMTLDEAGNLIVSDWSDLNGGIKYASPDLTSGGLVLDQQAGPRYGVINGLGQPIHGSIVSKPYVTGSVGNNLTVWAMDEDLETAPLANDGNSVWKWNVGSATNYDGTPDLVINSSQIGTTTQGGTIFLNLNIGVLADAHYEPRFNKWYLTQPRADGNESGITIVTPPSGSNPQQTVWSSIQNVAIDFGLDGWLDQPACPGSLGIQDIFRRAGSITISQDGTKMFLHRSGIDGITITVPPSTACTANGTYSYENRYLGQNSPYPGAILIIPLDANGIPIVQVNDNGTPGDPSDDFITNFQSITIASNNNNHTRHGVHLDAAGNLYVTNNISERLEVWSPGGNTRAITRSNGTFEVQNITGVTGDFNNDGQWNCLDINALTAAIASGSTNLAFDMNGDSVITLADITDASVGWLAVGGANNPGATGGNPFLPGDANLNGNVGQTDFQAWFDNRFTNTAAWCSGDFDANGRIDGSDFGIFNRFKGMSSALVPEPSSLTCLIVGLLAMASRRGSS